MSQVAPWHVVSSWTRDRTHVPWIGRQIHNHQTMREVQAVFLECRFHGLPLLRTLQWRSKPCRGEQSLPGAQWLAPSASPTWFSPPYIFPVTLAFPQGCQFTLVGGGSLHLLSPPPGMLTSPTWLTPSLCPGFSQDHLHSEVILDLWTSSPSPSIGYFLAP